MQSCEGRGRKSIAGAVDVHRLGGRRRQRQSRLTRPGQPARRAGRQDPPRHALADEARRQLGQGRSFAENGFRFVAVEEQQVDPVQDGCDPPALLDRDGTGREKAALCRRDGLEGAGIKVRVDEESQVWRPLRHGRFDRGFRQGRQNAHVGQSDDELAATVEDRGVGRGPSAGSGHAARDVYARARRRGQNRRRRRRPRRRSRSGAPGRRAWQGLPRRCARPRRRRFASNPCSTCSALRPPRSLCRRGRHRRRRDKARSRHGQVLASWPGHSAGVAICLPVRWRREPSPTEPFRVAFPQRRTSFAEFRGLATVSRELPCPRATIVMSRETMSSRDIWPHWNRSCAARALLVALTLFAAAPAAGADLRGSRRISGLARRVSSRRPPPRASRPRRSRARARRGDL